MRSECVEYRLPVDKRRAELLIENGPAYATAGNHGSNVVRDADGGIHAAWRDQSSTVMYRYGTQDATTGFISWSGPAIDISDGTASSRCYVSLAATANAVHFAWRGSGNEVRYRRLARNGGGWSFDPVRATGADGDSNDNGPDIAAYTDDEVHVLSRDLDYAYTRDGGATWTSENLYSRMPAGTSGIKYPALTVDPRGHVHFLVTTQFRGNYWPESSGASQARWPLPSSQLKALR